MGKLFAKCVVALFSCIVATTVATLANEPVDIREWKIPYEGSRPRDPFAENASSVWFVGQRTGYLAHLNAATGEIMKVDLKEGSGPHNLIVGTDGVVWYAGNRNALDWSI